MAIITISREYGSDGDQICQGIVSAKPYVLVDKKDMGKVLSQYGMISFGDFYDADHVFMDRFDKDKDSIVKMLNQTILAFARQDNIIIQGRGGFAVLQGYSNVLNILIKAPFAVRVSHVMKAMEISSQKEAEKLVEQNDRVRKSFLQTYYGIKLDDSKQFDLVIDTGKIPDELAVRWIVEASDWLDKQKDGLGRNVKTILVDSVLEDVVKKSLKAR